MNGKRNLSKSQPLQMETSKKKEEKPLNLDNWEFVEGNQEIEPISFGDVYESQVCKKTNFRSKFRGLTEPMQFFQLFFTSELVNMITEYTNRKAQNFYALNPLQNTHQQAWKDCSNAEIKAFFAMQMHMGLTKAPTYRFYWNQDPKFRVNGVADVMSRDRFFLIKRHVYYSEAAEENNDEFQKIRPFLDQISSACESYWIAAQTLTIDESMINFSGRHAGVVHVPRKPIPNGFKVYVLSDSGGYVIKFKPSFLFPPKTPIRVIVMGLMQGYERKGFHLFIDR